MTPTQIARQEDRRAWLEFRDQERKRQERTRRLRDVSFALLFVAIILEIAELFWWLSVTI